MMVNAKLKTQFDLDREMKSDILNVNEKWIIEQEVIITLKSL